jgi:hypothetical protein
MTGWTSEALAHRKSPRGRTEPVWPEIVTHVCGAG